MKYGQDILKLKICYFCYFYLNFNLLEKSIKNLRILKVAHICRIKKVLDNSGVPFFSLFISSTKKLLRKIHFFEILKNHYLLS